MGEPKLRSYDLLRKAWESRVFGCLAIAVALPTVGAFATILVGLAPVAAALAVAPQLAGVAVALGPSSRSARPSVWPSAR